MTGKMKWDRVRWETQLRKNGADDATDIPKRHPYADDDELHDNRIHEDKGLDKKLPARSPVLRPTNTPPVKRAERPYCPICIKHLSNTTDLNTHLRSRHKFLLGQEREQLAAFIRRRTIRQGGVPIVVARIR